jgi:hypothetical protein
METTPYTAELVDGTYEICRYCFGKRVIKAFEDNRELALKIRDHLREVFCNDDQHGQHAALPTAHPAARIQGHPDMQGVCDISGIGAAYNAG